MKHSGIRKSPPVCRSRAAAASLCCRPPRAEPCFSPYGNMQPKGLQGMAPILNSPEQHSPLILTSYNNQHRPKIAENTLGMG